MYVKRVSAEYCRLKRSISGVFGRKDWPLVASPSSRLHRYRRPPTYLSRPIHAELGDPCISSSAPWRQTRSRSVLTPSCASMRPVSGSTRRWSLAGALATSRPSAARADDVYGVWTDTCALSRPDLAWTASQTAKGFVWPPETTCSAIHCSPKQSLHFCAPDRALRRRCRLGLWMLFCVEWMNIIKLAS